MKTSTEIASAARLVGEEKAIEYIARAGFDGWDLSQFAMCEYNWQTQSLQPTSHPLSGREYLRFVRQLKKVGLDNGIVCNQSHAPFPSLCVGVDYLLRAIECTAEAGGQICVIHPDNNSTPQENAELYSKLLPFAREHGVKIATENMWNWEKGASHSSFAACATADSFCEHIDITHDDHMVACLDIGHAEMQGSGEGAVSMIQALGHRLQALHIHDNDRIHDSHQIPFSMNIAFEPIVEALQQIGYSGWLTLEADQYLKAFSRDNAQIGVERLYAAVRRIADMFQ